MKQVNTVLREAFENIQVRHVKKKGPGLVPTILNSLNRKVGLVRSDVWNANLSMRTAKALNANAAWDFKHQPRTAYDAMVSGA